MLVFFLFLSMGAVQLFFGNIENYSLLGAGSMLYLYLALLYLQKKIWLGWPALALALTICIHISAAWLLPTFPLLALQGGVRFSQGPGGYRFFISRQEGRRLLRGMGSALAIFALCFAFTIALGLHFLGDAKGLSWQNFGGGDGRLWVPIFSITTPYEKFTMFSSEHFIALLNQILLICPTGVFLLSGYLLFTLRKDRRYDRQVIFLATSAICYLSYIFLFNPDMAFTNVGILNEWDLFSPPAFPLIGLAAYLLLNWEKDKEKRRYIGAICVVTGFVHTASWILSNARITF